MASCRLRRYPRARGHTPAAHTGAWSQAEDQRPVGQLLSGSSHPGRAQTAQALSASSPPDLEPPEPSPQGGRGRGGPRELSASCPPPTPSRHPPPPRSPALEENADVEALGALSLVPAPTPSRPPHHRSPAHLGRPRRGLGARLSHSSGSARRPSPGPAARWLLQRGERTGPPFPNLISRPGLRRAPRAPDNPVCCE